MDYQQAVSKFGLKSVEDIAQNLEFSNRVCDQGYTEFSSTNNDLIMTVLVPTDIVDGATELDQINWDTYVSSAEFEQL
jgi:hypothetical protein